MFGRAFLFSAAFLLIGPAHTSLAQRVSVGAGADGQSGTVSSTAVQSPTRDESRNEYALQVGGTGISNLVVGTAVGDAPIVILRPSPGDDYWYRLPYSVAVRGMLPEGIELIQKGPGFHQLARLSGTPKTPGVYSFTLRATMADGVGTAELPISITVTNPSEASNVMIFPSGRMRYTLGENLKEWLLSVYVPTSPWRLPLGSSSSMRVSGLPPGLSLEPVITGEGAEAMESGGFEIVGIPTQVGTFDVVFEWVSKASAVLGRAQSRIEVLGSDFVVSRMLRVNAGAGLRPLRQFERVGPGTPGIPSLGVHDSLGRSVESGYKVVVEGLPKGLAVAAAPPFFPALEGASQEAGVFTPRFKAVFDDGVETDWQSVEIRVVSSGWLANRAAAAGVYDCLVERSGEMNRNDGGRLMVTVTSSGAVSGYLLNGFSRFAFASKDVVISPESGSVSIRPPGSNFLFEGTIEEDDQGYSTPDRRIFVLSGNLRKPDGTAAVPIRGMQAVVRGGAYRSPYASPLPVNLMVMKGDIFSMAEEIGDAPAGISFMSLRISSAGVVTATVWPADGSAPASTSTRLIETEGYGARFNLHFALSNSSGRNSMLAQMFVNLAGDAAGLLSWFQNAAARGIFPEGIPLIEYGGVIGSRDLPGKAGLSLDGFEKGLANAELELLRAEGQVDAEEVLTVGESAVSMARRPVAALPAGAAAAAAPSVMTGMSMRYDPRSGIVTGSARMRPVSGGPNRPVTFRGIRAPDGKFVAGHYVVSGVGKTVPPVTGLMRIMPLPSAR